MPAGLAVVRSLGTARSLRSVEEFEDFEILKNRKLVFQNPLARIRTWVDTRQLPLPADPAPIRAALDPANPARAAITALVAFHGLTTSQLRSLELTDVADGKLRIDDRLIPLAGPVRDRLAGWLDHRQTRWPTAANPRMFINVRNAQRDEPVGNRWIRLTLDLPGNVRALRRDRIVDEVLATGGDARRLSDLFGISIQTANIYSELIAHPDLEHEMTTPAPKARQHVATRSAPPSSKT